MIKCNGVFTGDDIYSEKKFVDTISKHHIYSPGRSETCILLLYFFQFIFFSFLFYFFDSLFTKKYNCLDASFWSSRRIDVMFWCCINKLLLRICIISCKDAIAFDHNIILLAFNSLFYQIVNMYRYINLYIVLVEIVHDMS
jgi:hypothetical protein